MVRVEKGNIIKPEIYKIFSMDDNLFQGETL